MEVLLSMSPRSIYFGAGCVNTTKAGWGIGATMQPDKDSPWQLDLNLAGFAGKKEGFSGGVSVAWMF